MYLHVHDGVQVAYDHECPVCQPILSADPTAIITDAFRETRIDG